jgi:hypothetical protein
MRAPHLRARLGWAGQGKAWVLGRGVGRGWLAMYRRRPELELCRERGFEGQRLGESGLLYIGNLVGN